MESTICSLEDCKFVKAGFCKKCEDCPFYVESWWQSVDQPPKLIKDCFPKRSLLIQQESINRCLALQSANEQQRNEFRALAEVFKQTINMTIKMIPSSIEKEGQIEDKST